MDTKKFEQLMDLVINEDNERAQELFHEIVVEKSREIFESIMAEEMEDEMMEDDEGGMGGQVGDLLDEIDAEESGMMEDDEEGMEFGDEDDMDFGDEEVEFSDEEDFGDEEGEEVEDAVIRIEDKLDQLMAEFEEIMGGGEEEDFGDEEEDFGDEEEALAEAIQLKKVSVTHGDNGAQTKSPGLQNSGQAGMDSKPVKFSGDNETVPTGPKAGQVKDLKGAGNFKNSPGKDNFKDKGEAAPKPKHGDDGANTKSPVAESRRSAKRRIR